MRIYQRNLGCIECEIDIENKVFFYSIDTFSYPLCRRCQDWFRDILDYTTASSYAIDLYFALKDRGVPAKLEKCDGFKTVDIAVPQAKVNIEVDGMQHAYSGRQALADLKRTLHSYKKGYSTLRIPNALARYDLEQAADLITEYLIESRKQKKRRYY